MTERPLDVWQAGSALLARPSLNKATAFTDEERDTFDLHGLLPPDVETLEAQVSRSYDAYQRKSTDLERHIMLRQLQDANETLFYALLAHHIEEMLPVIYTPTVGEACQQFSEIYRRPRGLFLSYPLRHRMAEMLEHAPNDNVEVIVVTDGERILGLGDQGAGGMGIPIGKLSIYSACGGIDPATTLPIVLDVGTNNQERIADPLYLGWRHERVGGQDYDDFIEEFVTAVQLKYPNVLLQWEDFAQRNASRLLERYRDRLCTFNDDIQGTAAVALGTLIAAVKVVGARLADQRVVVFGAGSAGCGIAERIVHAMTREGLSDREARGRLYMIDRAGLLHDGMTDLLPMQQRLVQPRERVADWASAGGEITLADTVRHLHPTVLVGVSAQPGRFTEEVIRDMAAHVERPIVFPLSNPTSRVEATPIQLTAWTDGRALIATGSPFEPVAYGGRSHDVAQCNNAYIFPGMGLGVLAAGARRVTDEMFAAAAEELASCSPALKDPTRSLLAPVAELLDISRRIATAVAQAAVRDGVAPEQDEAALEAAIEDKVWQPRYRPYRRIGRPA